VEENSDSASGSVIVTRPVSSPEPVVVLRAPLLLGVCEDFLLDASGSYGAAGRQLSFAYGMLPNVPNEQVPFLPIGLLKRHLPLYTS
jgi:hypothetical protein